MKILHMWSTAGVGSNLSKYLNQLYGLNTHCIMRRKYDPYDLNPYGTVYDCNWFVWFLICLFIPCRYHIIHIHSYDKILPFIRPLYPRKKMIIHYHGTLIRNNWSSREKYYRLADKILVSTPDLLDDSPDGVTYIPNPIDYDLIDELRSEKKTHRMFHVDRYAPDIAQEYASNLGIELDIFHNDETPLHHKDLLRLMTKYRYYVDVKRDYDKVKVLEALSLTGLEASYGGAILINWNGDIIPEFPREHRKVNVMKSLYKVYQELMSDE